MKKLTQFPATDTGLLAMRLVIGIVFMFHGSQKLFGAFGGSGIEGFAGFLDSLGIPFPMLNAYLAGSAEFFGGLALFTGVLARLATIPMTITMLVAILTVHGNAFAAQNGGMEFPLSLAAVLIGLGLTGPGRFTVVELYRRIAAPSQVVTAGKLESAQS